MTWKSMTDLADEDIAGLEAENARLRAERDLWKLRAERMFWLLPDDVRLSQFADVNEQNAVEKDDPWDGPR